MNTWRLILAEIGFRKLNVVFSFLALLTAAALFVVGPTLLAGYQREAQRQLQAMNRETGEQLARLQHQADQDLIQLEDETRRVMRDLGFNLRIVHRDTDLTALYTDFVGLDMPQEYVRRLAESPQITKIAHLVATLRQMVEWDGKPRLLVGIAPETPQAHAAEKSPMGLQVPAGFVFLGSVAGEGKSVGDRISVLGKEFEIGMILPAHGRADEDVSICMNLADAQQVLNKPGRITEILALGCKCKTVNRVEEITAQLSAVLPEARVLEHLLPANAREEQRQLVARHHEDLIAEYATQREQLLERERQQQARVLSLLEALVSRLTPVLIAVAIGWVGLLAWLNVRERRTEIGLLHALGRGSARIAGLFLGKALLLGTLAGAVGCVAGIAAARWFTLHTLHLPLDHFTPALSGIWAAVLGAPLAASAASAIPIWFALRQDPSRVLMDH